MKVGIKGKSEIRKRPAKRSHICYGNDKNNTIQGNARLCSGLVNDPSHQSLISAIGVIYGNSAHLTFVWSLDQVHRERSGKSVWMNT